MNGDTTTQLPLLLDRLQAAEPAEVKRCWAAARLRLGERLKKLDLEF